MTDAALFIEVFPCVQGDFFFAALFLWNVSTVPLQLRWFQSTSGMQKGLLYQLNNLALLLSFLPCRILTIPYLMQLYGATKGWPLHKVTQDRFVGFHENQGPLQLPRIAICMPLTAWTPIMVPWPANRHMHCSFLDIILKSTMSPLLIKAQRSLQSSHGSIFLSLIARFHFV